MFKKKIIQIAELRAEPVKDVQISLPEELYQSKLHFHGNAMQWKVKREVVGDVQTISQIQLKIYEIEEKQKQQTKQELDQMTKIVDDLEQKKIDQIRQIRQMADDKEKTQQKLEKTKRLYLQSEIRNEQIKKMILEEEQRFSQLILN